MCSGTVDVTKNWTVDKGTNRKFGPEIHTQIPKTTLHNKPAHYESSNQRAPSKCGGLSDSKFRGRYHFKDVAETEIIDPSS